MPKILLSVAMGLMAMAAVLSFAFTSPTSFTDASSHRESPLLLGDPLADATDLYAFVSPDNADTVTLIANWVPLEEPGDAPNYYQFGDAPEYVYGVNIDNDGDAEEDIRYEWRFTTDIQNTDTFLYNTGPITSLTDPDFNVRQSYTLNRVDIESGESTVLGSDLPTPPVNIGPRSTPDYDALASAAIVDLGGERLSFAGQRDDPFFIDLGSIGDVLALRNPGSDTVDGFNTHTVALQVPYEDVARTDCDTADAADAMNGECVIGIWSTTHRPTVNVLTPPDAIIGDLDCDGEISSRDNQALLRAVLGQPGLSQTEPCPDLGTDAVNNTLAQVSRLGNPLVNEVVVPLGSKDAFNASEPKDDAQFAAKVTDPELAGLLNLIYAGILEPVPTSGRTDLVTVFLTGIPTVTMPPNVVAAEVLRLNVAIPPSATPDKLGVLAGDFAGYPNGRRLADDVTDIALRAVACGYGAVYTVPGFDPFGPCDSATFGTTANNSPAVGDNVDTNDKAFLDVFPYVAAPHQGFDHDHEHDDISTVVLPMGLGIIGLLLGMAIVLPRVFPGLRRFSFRNKA